ncbi:MAG: hypothetical protein MR949_10865 [Veillonellaceae bacterium]|nr:hypothetical protein [Veillonellaceae bacterium]
MILEKDVTRDMLADVVQSYLDDLRKEKKEAKEAYKNDKEAVFDRDLSMAFQLAEDMLIARLSTIADVS